MGLSGEGKGEKRMGLGPRYLVALVVFALLMSLPFPRGHCQEIETGAASAILLAGGTGEVLFEKDPHTPRAPASMTKIMTLLLAFDAINAGRITLRDQVAITEGVKTLGEDPGTWVWLEPGEIWSLEELLVAIAVASANDACVAVAEHIAGNESIFVELMNQRAQDLGMENTHFQNSHGLSADEHYMSAYDTALLSREASKHAGLLKLTSIYEYPGFRPEPRRLDLWNTNKLLVWYEGVDGLKTGWTEEADYCLAATAQRNGLRLISVVMGCGAANTHFSESIKLLQYGFANYFSQRAVSKGQILEQIPVLRGKEQAIGLVAAEDLDVILPKGEKDFTVKVNLERKVLTAPVDAGTECGQIQVWRGNKITASVALVASRSVERGNFLLSSWRFFKKWFQFGG